MNGASVIQGQSHVIPPPPGSVSATWLPPSGVPTTIAGELGAWLDACEDELAHPEEVRDQLRRAGWPTGPAAAATTQYRQRFNEHKLGYSALLITTGLAALAAGTAGHLLANGLDNPVNRNALASALTLFFCTVPFAVWGHVWAAHTDREDLVSVWSGPRRTLAKVLLWSCGVVGTLRLVAYAAQLMGVLVGASWAAGASVVAGAVNVAITVSIALPLAVWAYRFLHRFDEEDPSIPAERRRSSRNGRRPASRAPSVADMSVPTARSRRTRTA